MLNKNKKIIVGILLILVLIIIVFLASLAVRKKNEEQLAGTKKAVNLDEYIQADPELLPGGELEAAGIERKEIIPPVSTQIPINKITMLPVGLGGGDSIYTSVVELPGNQFFKLGGDNIDKVFSVSNPQEALKYVDFLMVTLGRSNYDRVKQTVWQAADYDKIGCGALPGNGNRALPKERPVSQAKISGDGFEVEWVYFTPALAAGYHKTLIQVEKNGGFTVKDNSGEPFWSCGGGFVF